MQHGRIETTVPQGMETRGPRGAGRREAAEGAEQASAGGFALLLSALGAADGASRDMPEAPLVEADLSVLDGYGLDAPDGLPLPAPLADAEEALTPPEDQSGASSLAWLLASRPAGAESAQAAPADATDPGAGLPGQGARWAPGAAAATQVGLGLVRPGTETLVGETAALDGQGEVRNARSAPAGLRAGRAALAASAADQAAGSRLPVGHRHALADAPGLVAGPTLGASRTLAGAGNSEAAGARQSGGERTPEAPGPAWSGGERMQPQALSALPVGAAWQPGADAARPGGGHPGGGAPGAGGFAGAVAAAEPERTPGEGLDPADAAGLPLDGEAAEALLAERITHWVHQGIQNAALTVEREGAAVQVQVALRGSEAHVQLRSDDAQARQLLDAGSGELRTLLQEQGLQLAGMSVSSQAAGGGSAREQDAVPAGAGRRGVVRAAAPEGAENRPGTPRGRGIGERSVDVYA